MPTDKTRRKFLKTGVALGTGFWLGTTARRGYGQEAETLRDAGNANEQIQFACIGVDGKGKSDSSDAGFHGEVVAICDVDARALEKSAIRYPDAKQFHDYRELLTEMGDKVDAVTVSTPDHSHAIASVMAMKMGKHCFCQKPLTHSISEARVMGNVAREAGVKTQMGNQGTALASLREGAAVLQSGVLGRISDVHVWTNRPVWPQGMDRPVEEPAVPDYLHWDQWIGPAPFRPYHEAYHPFKWRGFWEFGTGALGDMACHTLNMPYMGLDLRDPISVEAETSGHNRETFPGWSVIKFQFPKIGSRDALALNWYDGGKQPDSSLIDESFIQWLRDNNPEVEDPQTLMRSGVLVIGENGKMFAPGDYGSDWILSSELERPEVTFTESPGHFTEWVDAIDGGPEAISNFPDYAGPLTETILLGNLAVWSGKRVEWDAKKLIATNAPELASIVKREYRDGYSLDALVPVGASS